MFVFVNQRRVKIIYLFYVCGVPAIGLRLLQFSFSVLFFSFFEFFFSLQGACENASVCFVSRSVVHSFVVFVDLPIVDQNRLFL